MKIQNTALETAVNRTTPYPEDLQLLSLRQLSILTGLGLTKINEELSSKRLRSLKLGRRRLVTVGDLRYWVQTYSENQETSVGVAPVEFVNAGIEK